MSAPTVAAEAPSAPGAAAPSVAPTRRPGFGSALLLVVLLAALVRIPAALGGPPCEITNALDRRAEVIADGGCTSFNDAATYLEQAGNNAEGRWLQVGALDEPGRDTALHAPAFGLVLAPLVAIGLDDLDALRPAVALLGLGTVALVGLLGRRLGGPRVGLLAATIAALHPLVWINDVVVMPEGLFAGSVAGVALVALRVHARPTPTAALALGAAIGGAALVRNEALLCVAFIGLPLVGGLRLPVADRLVRIGALVAGAALVVAPWVGLNWARFGTPTFTHGTGAGIRSAACDETFYNPHLVGLRSADCLAGDRELTDPAASDAEAATDRTYRRQAASYYRENLGRAPVVVLARIGRFWGAWRPFETVRLDDAIEQRGVGRAQAGVVVGWALLPASVYGGIVLWRRRVPLSPLLGWVAASTVVAAASQPLQRFRIGGDVGLLVLAAVGVVAALDLPSVRRTLGLDPVAEPVSAPAEG